MKRVMILLKLVLSAACLYVAFHRIDWQLTQNLLYSTIGFQILIAATGMMCLQILLAVFRLSFLAKGLARPITFKESLKISWVGAFFSQMAFSFVSGDAMRVWYLKKPLKTLKFSFYTVAIDRMFGLFSLGILFLFTLPFFSHIPWLRDQPYLILTILVFTGILTLLGTMSLYCFQKRWQWITVFLNFIHQTFLQTPFNTALLLFLSLLIHCCNIVVVYSALIVFEIPINFGQCFIIMVPTMLAMMLPVSIGGWGIRESAMLMGFSTLNYAPEPILTTSILLGLSLLAASLPGFFLFLGNKPSKEINGTNTKNACAVIAS
jgi:uncharacterized protein (TIRG00374 family)